MKLCISSVLLDARAKIQCQVCIGGIAIYQGVHCVPDLVMVGCITLTTNQEGDLRRA